MGAFTDLFGYIPRVEVLEAFAETPDDRLSAPDIERITEVSRRAAYLIIRDYVESGVLVNYGRAEGGGAQRFGLNPEDLRARTLVAMERLITLGAIQAQIKRMRDVPQSDRLPPGSVSRIPYILLGVLAVEVATTAALAAVTHSLREDTGTEKFAGEPATNLGSPLVSLPAGAISE